MRPRTLTLHPMTAKRLLRLRGEAEGDGAYRVAKRIHVVLLNYDGYTSGQITAMLKTPRSRVSEWLTASALFTAMATAFDIPTNTTSRLPLVIPVYNKFRCNVNLRRTPS